MRRCYLRAKFFNAHVISTYRCRVFHAHFTGIIITPNHNDFNSRNVHSSLDSKTINPQSKLLGFVSNLNSKVALGILHCKVFKNGSILDLAVGNYILSLYVKFSLFSDARKMFDEMPERDVRTWTLLISGFARNGSFRMGLGVFKRMLVEGECPNQFTLSSILKCCSNGGEILNGKAVHGWILRNEIGLDDVLRNSMLDFYVKCDELGYAETLFELADGGDTVSWNIVIGGYIQSGCVESSLDLFKRLPSKNISSWNTVLSGLMQNGYQRTALELLYEMVNVRANLNEYTFAIALALASSLSYLELGKQIHAHWMRLGFHNDFIRSSLIDMYCKCGEVDKASVIFKQMPRDILIKPDYSENSKVDTVCWSSIVSGYVQNSWWGEALEIFCSMFHEGIKIDKFTLTSIISASADCGMLEFGQQIHSLVLKSGHKLDVVLLTSLVDMYAKCGSLDDARLVFIQISDRNVIAWTSMISACALHGKGKEAVRLFELMRDEGIRPNEVSFVGVLTACSHAGLVDQGCEYFKTMKEACKIKPGVEHFTCMIDLFGRAGRFSEIKNFIYENGISHLSSVWRAFLSACRVHKNVELGKWVAEKLLQLEPLDAEPYVLFSNMCATDHRWEESAELRSLMQKKGVIKQPGQSWIQLNSQVHTFVMGDQSHPQGAEIYSYMHKLLGRLKEIGYSADVGQVMQDVEEEQREMFLQCHSEKLAVVYGIIRTANGTPIRVIKNLRICSDCHNFFKYTSQLLGREIIVRDIRRFHIFKEGQCSCGDYW